MCGLSVRQIAQPATSIDDAMREAIQDLVAKGALVKSGELRHKRYRLNIPDQKG